MFDFSNKTAVITGGTRGIGKAIVDLLIDFGCEVIYTGTKKEDKNLADKKIFIQLDFTKPASIKAFLDKIKALPKIDILINNAGINIIEPIDEVSIDNWNKVLNVNLTSAMILTKEISKKMKQNTFGRVLNLSSIFGISSRPKRNAYSATKAGLIGLTKASALDLAPYGILVNALCPGFTSTELTTSILSQKEIDELNLQIPLGRFAETQEIAKTAVFLCSDVNTYITGQTIVVDGGYTI